MSPEERPNQVQAVDEYVDALLDGSKPPRAPRLKGADAELLRAAAMLASVESPRSQPSAEFVERLRSRFDDSQRRWWNVSVSRRGLAGSLAAGASILAAALLGGGAWQRLRAGNSVPAGWVPVAEAADLPPGTVRRFSVGAAEGHVMNIGGKIWALSAICTHLACTLEWQPQQQEFLCPCHGAEFDSSGQQTGVETYELPLQPLAKIPVQQLNGTIYVIPD